MTYTEYCQSLRASGWWKTREARAVWHKREGQDLAKSLGIPTPASHYFAGPVIAKPISATCGKGCVAFSGAMLVEELLAGPDGKSPADLRVFVVRGAARLLCHDAKPDGVLRHDDAAVRHYWWLPSLEWVAVDRRTKGRDTGRPCWLDASVIEQCTEWAERIHGTFDELRALRVDFLLTDRGPVFGEMEATPGVFEWSHGYDRPDRIMGALIEGETAFPDAPAREVDPASGDEMIFTADYTTDKIARWPQWLGHLAGEPARMLELGFYEGRSSEWFLDHVLTHSESRLTSVERWPRRGERNARILEARHGERFRFVAADATVWLADQVRLAAAWPQDAGYDAIYLDAGKEAAMVLEQSVLAWRLLKPGGILIWDDYGWTWREGCGSARPHLPPGPAIDAFRALHAHELEVVHQGWQVCVRRR